jgi:hypothetical protein
MELSGLEKTIITLDLVAVVTLKRHTFCLLSKLVLLLGRINRFVESILTDRLKVRFNLTLLTRTRSDFWYCLSPLFLDSCQLNDWLVNQLYSSSFVIGGTSHWDIEIWLIQSQLWDVRVHWIFSNVWVFTEICRIAFRIWKEFIRQDLMKLVSWRI